MSPGKLQRLDDSGELPAQRDAHGNRIYTEQQLAEFLSRKGIAVAPVATGPITEAEISDVLRTMVSVRSRP